MKCLPTYVCLRICFQRIDFKLIKLLHPLFSEINEYCLTETFEASCRNDEVIVMEAATFGRMRLGRYHISELLYPINDNRHVKV